MEARYKICKNLAQVKKLIACCKETGYACLDFETTSGKFYEITEHPTVLGISYQPGSAVVVPLYHDESPFKHNYRKVLKLIGREVISNPDIVKIGQNFKFEHSWFLRFNIVPRGRILDTMLAKYLLDEERPHDLKSMVSRFIPEYSDYESEIQALARQHGWAKIPMEPLAKYNALDCILTFKLMLFFEPKLMELNMYSLFRNLLMQLSRTLAESEYRGILVDKQYLEGITADTRKKLDDLYQEKVIGHKVIKRYIRKSTKVKVKALIKSVKQEISDLQESGKGMSDRVIVSRLTKIQNYSRGIFTTKKELKMVEPINLNSSHQLIDFLFTSKHGLQLPVVRFTVDKKTKQQKTTPSTDETSLLELRELDETGFIDTLLLHRSEQKLYSTYMVGILEKISSKNRIHTKFNIHGTVTGRLSSTNPNLQNIPRSTTSSLIKKMFIPPPGYLILEVDYSQAELRIVAELAKEKTMIKWFNEGRNIHVAVACKANGREDDYDEIYKISKDPSHPDYNYWTIRKKRAKTINFGILYGQGAKKLAETLNSKLEEGEKKTSEQAAAKFKKEWLETFPRIDKWIKGQFRFAYDNGYVPTVFGRKRRLPDIYLENSHKGKFLEAQRQSVNAPIQGASSDFTLFSSIIVREYILKGLLPRDMLQCYTVHDSIGYYIRPEDLHRVVPILDEICSNPQTGKYFHFQAKYVKMKVSFEVGRNWGSLQDYNPSINYTDFLNQQN
jgi:DNA polymerase-1